MAQNYKDTLLLPQTNFQMKGDLSSKEKLFSNKWKENNIYKKSLLKNKNKGKGTFILHDGPPYANGDLHLGHALNKILKDIIIRRKHMEGFYAPYIFGWDTHGLPIENKMLEDLQLNYEKIDPLIIRKNAKKYALKQIENQKLQFDKMNLFTDLTNHYSTFNFEYEAKQLKLFKKMVMNKIVYKGLKPIYWSTSSQSALAEAEVEYKDIRSPQIIVALKVTKGNTNVNVGDNLLIMTTTPWTLIANSGIAVSKKIQYCLVKSNNQNYVVAKDLLEQVCNDINIKEFKIIKTFWGSELLGINYQRPIKNNLEAPVVEGHHVNLEFGTGLVHIAPLFGEDDYIVGKKNNLDMIMHVNKDGILNEQANDLKGKFYFDANKDIGMFLDKNKNLLSLKFISHSYPHDWRTNKPIIYRGVPQWFVNIEPLKKQINQKLEQIKSIPKWGISRLRTMLLKRNEWTISRQRTWGVPIIIFYDKSKKIVIEEEIFDYVINLVQKYGTNIWWEWTTNELLPEKYRNLNFTREMDIMDVWYDSGSSFMAALDDNFNAPFDLYLEGSDQYRGWFNSSFINSIIWSNQAPFKKLISHGFVLDSKQNKMSKSKGNVISPLDIISKYGAEILRLWIANSEFTSDVSISQSIIEQNIEIYRRIRNTFKFMLGNLHNFDFEKNKVNLKGVHQDIYYKILKYNNYVKIHYNKYRFIDIIKETNKLFIDLSSWYFNYAKDVLYCDKEDALERRMIQTNIYYIVHNSIMALAPILPTTMEEIYEVWNKKDPQLSIFLERIKENKEFSDKPTLFEEQRKKVNLILEQAIQNEHIKRTNEAILEVNIIKQDRIASAKEYAKYFMVAKVIFSDKFSVKKFESEKCNRCWNHFKIGTLKNKLCLRCLKIINV